MRVYGRGWQEFVGHLAEQARQDQRARRQEAIGRALWKIVLASLWMGAVGLFFKYMRWL